MEYFRSEVAQALAAREGRPVVIDEDILAATIGQATLDHARVKVRSALYTEMEQFAGFGRANLLASFALFDDEPDRINQLEQGFARVTPALLQRTAQEYLRPTNRTIEFIVPAAKSAAGSH